MKFTFKKPDNKNNTGIFFLSRLLYENIKNSEYKKTSIMSLIKRKLSKKDQEIYIFLPLNHKILFSLKNDIIIFPDDSLRAIKSVYHVRWHNKEYIKFLFQFFRYYYTYLLILSIRNRLILIVSNDDVKSLKEKFKFHNIKYLHHPIQNQINEVPIEAPSLELNKVAFINLQKHYCTNPESFFDYIDMDFIKNNQYLKFYFHGSHRLAWFNIAKKNLYEINCFEVGYVENFISFHKEMDIIVMPLSAGAGVKNILLNSIYLKKIVFGTEEAFSGIPYYLAEKFIINDVNALFNKLNNINDIQEDYLNLRNYILEHHDISNFRVDLNTYFGE